MTKERFDIHQHITDKIVRAIERGACRHVVKSKNQALLQRRKH